MNRRLLLCWWQVVKAELAPFEGRMGAAWRVAAICMLTGMLFMVYELPLVAIGCYLVLFVMKPNMGESILMAIAICILVSLVIMMMFLLVRVSIEEPMIRMVIIAAGSFFFLFIGAASPLGPVGGIVALVIAFIMTLLGYIPFGEVATRALLYAWLMVLVPMGVVVAFGAAFGPSPLRLVRRTVAERLQLAAQALQGKAVNDQILEELREGNESASKALLFVRLFHITPKADSAMLGVALSRSLDVLMASAALLRSSLPGEPASDPQVSGVSSREHVDTAAIAAVREALVQRCLALAQAFEQGVGAHEPLWHVPPQMPADGPFGALDVLLAEFPGQVDPAPDDGAPPKHGFFFPDVLTNPAYQRFALKTTLAAIVCYLVYTTINWQDIHTAMITCYVAALGTTGETVHKLTLRIIGCLIGATLGVASILLVMPYMTSIGELMLLVFAGSLCAAWVSCGSERSSYAGVQIGLAFLMTVLQGFGPDVELSVAMDRIFGILLGNTVLFIVFTRIWPASTGDAATQQLGVVLDDLDRRLTLGSEDPDGVRARATARDALVGVGKVRNQLAMMHFEPESLRPETDKIRQLHDMATRIEGLCLALALPPAPLGDAARRVRLLPFLTQCKHDLTTTAAA